MRQLCLAPELVAKWDEEMNFTKEQEEGMAEFRARCVQEGILHETYDHRTQFFRFMQARKWVVEDAFVMFRNHIAWRKEYDLDEWIPTPQGPVPKLLHEFKMPEIDSVKKGYSFTHHKCTKTGMPVYFDRLGSIDFKQMVSVSHPRYPLMRFHYAAST